MSMEHEAVAAVPQRLRAESAGVSERLQPVGSIAAEPDLCIKKAISWESLWFLVIFGALFSVLGISMGAVNMLNTLMHTAYSLLMDTVLYIMAIAVIAGAISGLLTEFGVVAAINQILSPLMKPVYGLPGASIIGVFATYLSDNPAILTLADDKNFRRYFKKYQIPALTNIGTAFGMGLIITTFMIGILPKGGGSFIPAVLIGNLGAVIGSIVSARLMLRQTAKIYGTTEMACQETGERMVGIRERIVRPGSIGTRFMGALLDGGKSGVNMGFAIIPGVLIICSLVMMLTNGAGEGGLYTGAAYEGIAFLPWAAEQLQFILEPLFGFASPEAVSVPITALGAAGAAIGLVPKLVEAGLAGGNDIAVFTAMCMCWSGYLSTHVAMMDSLKCPELTGKAILCHTVGGICAGISAHWLYVLII